MSTNILSQSTMTFVVADGLNTSYIDSILMSLFYKSSHLEEMLIQQPDNAEFIYLQEMISNNFIDLARRNFSIDSSIINEIRNYSLICGWKSSSSITELFSVVDYLTFLMTGFNFGGIKMEIVEMTDHDEEVRLLNFNYIEVSVYDEDNVDHLLKKWLENCTKKTKTISSIHYRFAELPMIIPIYINRHTEKDITNTSQIDIFKKIKFRKNNDKTQDNACWIIHAIICLSSSGSGHYYSLIQVDKKDWYLFSNARIPSLVKIRISDPDVALKIKKECVLILYRLNDDLM
jgi:hypothetical protein